MSNQTQQTSPNPCPECGGERITRIVTPRLIVRRSLFSSHNSNTNSLVCLSCGYTTLYAQEPGKLKDKSKQ